MNRYKRKRAKNCTFSIETHSIIVVEGINTRNRERAVVREKMSERNRKQEGERKKMSTLISFLSLSSSSYLFSIIINYNPFCLLTKMLLRYTCKTEDINIVITGFAIDSSMAYIMSWLIYPVLENFLWKCHRAKSIEKIG